MERLAVGRRQALVAMGAGGLLTAASPSAANAAARWRERKKYVAVFGQRMAYYETGKGRPTHHCRAGTDLVEMPLLCTQKLAQKVFQFMMQ